MSLKRLLSATVLLLASLAFPHGAEATPALGACCVADSTCIVLPEPICLQQQGTFQGPDTLCEPNPCLPPPPPEPEEGACCLPEGDCVVETQVRCEELGGTYLGDRTECGPDTCELPTATDLESWGRIKQLYR